MRTARPATTTAGISTLELAIDKAQATGDVRLAALARVNLGRVLRATGQDRRHGRRSKPRPRGTAAPAAESSPRSASACWPRWMPRNRSPDADQRLGRSSKRPDGRRRRRRGLRPRCAGALGGRIGDTGTAREQIEAADQRMKAAAHLITDLDRSDALWVRKNL